MGTENAPAAQQRAFWKKVRDMASEELKTHDKVWLSTHGGGVPFLHVRIETRPKYYHTPRKKEWEAANFVPAEPPSITDYLPPILGGKKKEPPQPLQPAPKPTLMERFAECSTIAKVAIVAVPLTLGVFACVYYFWKQENRRAAAEEAEQEKAQAQADVDDTAAQKRKSDDDKAKADADARKKTQTEADQKEKTDLEESEKNEHEKMIPILTIGGPIVLFVIIIII